MAEVVKFTSTRLTGSGKKGVLTPDADGYYEMVIGALNTFNSAGEYYTLEGAQMLFEQSSSFMRRVQSGCLKGEVGHPKRQPGMTMDQYVNRILSIEETNISHHIREVWLDPNYGRNNAAAKNPNLVAIVAKIKPAGPQGPALEKAFANPGEDVCFSIRALTKDYFNRGQCYRVLTQIMTWDWVTEPGIATSRKWASPALESFDEEFIMQSQIETVANAIREDSFAMESNRMIAIETLAAVKQIHQKQTPPMFKHW